MSKKISVCILTKNAQATLEKTLNSVRNFSEVIILDSGSTDSTLEIAKKHPNVKIFETNFCGFGPLRNKISSYSTNDWIFALDSDEVITDELFQEIKNTKLNPQFAYSVPRHNFYAGKRIRGCGWSPDYVARLYNRKTIQYSDSLVHESLVTKSIAFLKSPIHHTPYRNIEEFLSKMQHYSTLFAKQYLGKRRSSFSKALLHGVYAFIKSYFQKCGFLDGPEGFIISMYNANTAFYKYMKLKELSIETQ